MGESSYGNRNATMWPSTFLEQTVISHSYHFVHVRYHGQWATPRLTKQEPLPWFQAEVQLTSISLNCSLAPCACPQAQRVMCQHTVTSSESKMTLGWLAHDLASSTRVVTALWARACKNWFKIQGRHTRSPFFSKQSPPEGMLSCCL